MKNPATYIVTNKKMGTLYTGVTSNLPRRVYEHKQGAMKGFTKKYNCSLLVFFETHETMEYALMREKQIKSGSREKKLALIEEMNPEWKDLYETLI